MPLGRGSMSVAMKLAWGIVKITGMSIGLVSSVILKIVWALIGGAKK